MHFDNSRLDNSIISTEQKEGENLIKIVGFTFIAYFFLFRMPCGRSLSWIRLSFLSNSLYLSIKICIFLLPENKYVLISANSDVLISANRNVFINSAFKLYFSFIRLLLIRLVNSSKYFFLFGPKYFL